MERKRGRPPIKPIVKDTIAAKAMQDKKIPRVALAVELKELIEKMGEVSPSEETLTRLISEARNSPDTPLDKPWNIVTLEEHPIPPEALAKVLKVWVLYSADFGKMFTIRQARWVARFYALTDSILCLTSWSEWYALKERISEVTGIPLDTYLYDLEIYEDITGEKVSREEAEAILGVLPDGERWKRHFEVDTSSPQTMLEYLQSVGHLRPVEERYKGMDELLKKQKSKKGEPK